MGEAHVISCLELNRTHIKTLQRMHNFTVEQVTVINSRNEECGFIYYTMIWICEMWLYLHHDFGSYKNDNEVMMNTIMTYN